MKKLFSLKIILHELILYPQIFNLDKQQIQNLNVVLKFIQFPVINLEINKQIDNKYDQKIIIKYGQGKSVLFQFPEQELLSKLQKDVLYLIIIDKVDDQYIQMGQCLISLEQFSKNIDQVLDQNKEDFKRQYFMVFDECQQPIGQVDISFSLAQRSADYLNKKLNSNTSGIDRPKESQKNSMKNSRIKDNKSVTIKNNNSSNNHPINTSVRNTNPSQTKKSLNNSQSKFNKSYNDDIYKKSQNVIYLNTSELKKPSVQMQQSYKSAKEDQQIDQQIFKTQDRQDQRQEDIRQNQYNQNSISLKAIKEGNYCPPAIFFKNTDPTEKTQMEVIQEKTVKVQDPKIKYQPNSQKGSQMAKNIFQVNQKDDKQQNDYQSDYKYMLLDKLINELLLLRNAQLPETQKLNKNLFKNYEMNVNNQPEKKSQQYQQQLQDQIAKLQQEQQELQKENVGSQKINILDHQFQSNNIPQNPRLPNYSIYQSMGASASHKKPPNSRIINTPPMNQSRSVLNNQSKIKTSMDQSYMDDFENVSQTNTIRESIRKNASRDYSSSQFLQNTQLAQSYSYDFSTSQQVNKQGKKSQKHNYNDSNNQIYEDDFESEIQTSSHQNKPVSTQYNMSYDNFSYSNSIQKSGFCQYCKEKITTANKSEHLKNCSRVHQSQTKSSVISSEKIEDEDEDEESY